MGSPINPFDSGLIRRALAVLPGLLLATLVVVRPASAAPLTGPGHPDSSFPTPSWLYPISDSTAERAAREDGGALVHVTGSQAGFTVAQLHDMFNAIDWRPETHPTVPPIVAHGRRPGVYACGYCHMASGQGRPENSALAGLPADYIVRQVQDFRSGTRASAAPKSFFPAHAMAKVAAQVTDQELASAADYFAHLALRRRVSVIETRTVPQMRIVGWVYVPISDSDQEPIGQRLLEVAVDAQRHEQRDETFQYLAYAPPGSVQRGRVIATAGIDGPATACVICHGPEMKGLGAVPPLAGRLPSYLLRQLVDFRKGTRVTPAGQPMNAIAAGLSMPDMIAVAAYAASLQP